MATVILYTKEDEKMQNSSQVWVPGEWKDCGVKMENWKKEMTWQNENEFNFRCVEPRTFKTKDPEVTWKWKTIKSASKNTDLVVKQRRKTKGKSMEKAWTQNKT